MRHKPDRHAPAHWTGFAGQPAKWRGIQDIHHRGTEFTEEDWWTPAATKFNTY